MFFMLSRYPERLTIALLACGRAPIAVFAVSLTYGVFSSTFAHADDYHDKAASASFQTIEPSVTTVSVTLPTTLLYDFFQQRRAVPELDKNKAVARYITGLPIDDRIALAHILLDDRDIRVRAFAIATLVDNAGTDATRTALYDVAKRIGLAPTVRAEQYAALKYDMPATAFGLLSAGAIMKSTIGRAVK